MLNPEKCVFCESEVDFAGFTITENNVRPCQKYMQAIRDFSTPKSTTDVHSWFGLMNQVSYAFSMAECMLPYCQLLKSGTPFSWDDNLNAIFEESKSIIINEIKERVEIFELVDWLKEGIGFWLLQKHCPCSPIKPFCCYGGWKTSLVGSHHYQVLYGPGSRTIPIGC